MEGKEGISGPVERPTSSNYYQTTTTAAHHQYLFPRTSWSSTPDEMMGLEPGTGRLAYGEDRHPSWLDGASSEANGL